MVVVDIFRSTDKRIVPVCYTSLYPNRYNTVVAAAIAAVKGFL